MSLTDTQTNRHDQDEMLSVDVSRIPLWVIAGILAFIAVMLIIFMSRGEALKCPNGAILAKSCETMPIEDSLQYIETQVAERMQTISASITQELVNTEMSIDKLRSSIASIYLALEELMENNTNEVFYTIYYEYNRLLFLAILEVQYDVESIRKILEQQDTVPPKEL